MSEDVTYIGHLEEIERKENESLPDVMKRLIEKDLIVNADVIDKHYNNDIEIYFRENYSDQYIIKNDRIYKINIDSRSTYDDIFEASYNSDGTIQFVVQFYNGGCGLGEALEEALNKLDKK